MAENLLQPLLDQVEKMLFKTPEKGSAENSFGVITSYKDGVIQIKGLQNLKMGEVVTVQGTDNQALVMNLEKDQAFAVVLQSGEGVREGVSVMVGGRVDVLVGTGDGAGVSVGVRVIVGLGVIVGVLDGVGV